MKKEFGLGACILKDGNSMEFKTGSWKNRYPSHSKDLCKSCMLCIPYCPENCIKEKDGLLDRIELDYCKGCGVCAKVCPFKAIEMKNIDDETNAK
ncbi:MAG: 4Fe-4S binding protein [Clostridia bacterium]|nr:4Fe-4S binding protein [Clostridia bacterium]